MGDAIYSCTKDVDTVIKPSSKCPKCELKDLRAGEKWTDREG